MRSAVPHRSFAAHLTRSSTRASWGTSAALACAAHALLLWGAVSLPSPPAKPELRRPLGVEAMLMELPSAAEATGTLPEPPGGGSAASAAPQVRAEEKHTSAQPKRRERVSTTKPDLSKAAQRASSHDLKVEEIPKPADPPAAAASTPAVSSPSAATPSANVATPAGAGSGTGSGGGGGSGGSVNGAGGAAGTGSGKAVGRSDLVLPFGDGMSRPVLLSKVEPTYTREAMAERVEGSFIAKCVITVSGELTQCRVVKGLRFMDQAVLSALKQWRYSPVLYQGKPTSVEYVVSVRLVLP